MFSIDTLVQHERMSTQALLLSISEAVELVKTYSTEKSHAFVNGILSSVYKSMTAGK